MRGATRKATDEQILDAIAAYIEEHGYSPSSRDVGRMVGLRSASTVMGRLRMLRDAGLLRFDDKVPRSIVLVSRDA